HSTNAPRIAGAQNPPYPPIAVFNAPHLPLQTTSNPHKLQLLRRHRSRNYEATQNYFSLQYLSASMPCRCGWGYHAYKNRGYLLERVCEVMLASTEASVKLTVPFKAETCYTRLQV